MPDETQNESRLILELLREVREDQKASVRAISEINNNLVGRVACEKFRSEMWDEIDRLKSTCQEFETMKTHFVDGVELANAKKDVLDEATGASEARMDRIESDIREIKVAVQGAMTLLSVIKSNKSNILYVICFLVAVGRVGMVGSLSEQVGTEKALIETGIYCIEVFVVVGLIWLYQNRAKTKQWLLSW